MRISDWSSDVCSSDLIRQGEVAVAKPRVAPPSLKVPSLEPATLDLGDSLRSIADPELKAVLESLAAGVASTHGPPVFDKDCYGVHDPVAAADRRRDAGRRRRTSPAGRRLDPDRPPNGSGQLRDGQSGRAGEADRISELHLPA